MRRGGTPAILVIAVILATMLSIGGIAVMVGVMRQPAPALKLDDVDFPPAIDAALGRFAERGGAYEWGTNDCSVFVLDFLKASGVSIRRRLTTKELYDVGIMRGIGFDQVQTAEQTGEVVVFRYMERRPAGHCGLVVRHGDELVIVHNASSAGGVMVETWEQFLRRAESFGAARDSVRVFRMQQGDASPGSDGRLSS